MQNIRNLLESQNGRIVLLDDGTYRLTSIGWIVIILGCVELLFDSVNGKWRMSFRPYIFGFCKSEKFECFKQIYLSFFYVLDLLKVSQAAFEIKSTMRDASDASLKACKTVLHKMMKPAIESNAKRYHEALDVT